MMFDYQQLEALRIVEREGSIEGAARALGVSPSAISQRIKKLEIFIGASVLDRQKPVVLNDVGKDLCRHTKNVQGQEQTMIENYKSEFLKMKIGNRPVKIIVNDDSLSSWFKSVMILEAQKPKSHIFELVIADQDYSIDQMKSGTAQAAISNEQKAVSGFRSVFAGTHLYKAAARPEFVEKHFSDGVTLENIRAAPSLRYSFQDDLQRQWIKQVFGQEIEPVSHMLPSSSFFVDACLMGLGWGMNPSAMVDELIASGELVELIPEQILRKPLFWHYSRLLSDPLKGLTESVLAASKNELCQKDPPVMKLSASNDTHDDNLKYRRNKDGKQ